jgi:hypothetical protein
MRPVGGGKPFRGLEHSWFKAALRERESAAPDDTEPERGRLRLFAPALGLSLGLATSPGLVTAFSQVSGPVVGASLPGLVVVCSAVLALARRRRLALQPPTSGESKELACG